MSIFGVVRGRGTLVLAAMLAACSRAEPLPAPAPDPARFESEIAAYEAADRERMPAPGGVLFTGSSSVRLWKSLQQDFPGVPVLNRGFGGSQMSDLLHHADRLILPYRPRMVLVYEGDNDLNAGESPELLLAEYRALVRRVHAQLPDTRIGFISIKPSPSRWSLAPTAQRANEMVRQYTRTDPRLFYVDVWTPMLGPDGRPPESLFVADRLHMNESGYAIWRQAVAPYLDGSTR